MDRATRIDRLLAVHLFGWVLEAGRPPYSPSRWLLPDGFHQVETEPWSDTGDGMLEVIDAMRAKGYNWEMYTYTLMSPPRCWARLHSTRTADPSVEAGADELPTAVALAACRALGVAVPDEEGDDGTCLNCDR